jgi:hypothetical protein
MIDFLLAKGKTFVDFNKCFDKVANSYWFYEGKFSLADTNVNESSLNYNLEFTVAGANQG